MKNESYEDYQKKVHAYMEKYFPKYFSEVNRANFFSTFIHMPDGHEAVYNRKWRRGLLYKD